MYIDYELEYGKDAAKLQDAIFELELMAKHMPEPELKQMLAEAKEYLAKIS